MLPFKLLTLPLSPGPASVCPVVPFIITLGVHKQFVLSIGHRVPGDPELGHIDAIHPAAFKTFFATHPELAAGHSDQLRLQVWAAEAGIAHLAQGVARRHPASHGGRFVGHVA